MRLVYFVWRIQINVAAYMQRHATHNDDVDGAVHQIRNNVNVAREVREDTVFGVESNSDDSSGDSETEIDASVVQAMNVDDEYGTSSSSYHDDHEYPSDDTEDDEYMPPSQRKVATKTVATKKTAATKKSVATKTQLTARQIVLRTRASSKR